jgi:alanyl-tRNA synthetase
MRRIEAVTGRAAAERIRRNEDALGGIGAMLRAQPGEIGARIETLRDEADGLRRKVQSLERAAAGEQAEDLIARARSVDGVSILAARVTASSTDYLRDLGDGLKARLGSAVILLGADIDGKPAFVAMSTPDVAKRVPAGEIVRAASQASGGGGGGRPELAQGGGTDLSKLDEALAAGAKLAEERLTA